MKAGDKQTDTLTSLRMIGDVALCTGTFTFAPASGDANKGNWTKWRERWAASGRF
jgi:hypothetical protein